MQEIRRLDDEIKKINGESNSINSKLEKYEEKKQTMKKEKIITKINNKIEILQSKLNENETRIQYLEKSKAEEKERLSDISLAESTHKIATKADRIMAQQGYDTHNFTVIKQMGDQISMALQNIDQRLRDLEINNGGYVMNDFIVSKNIRVGMMHTMFTKDIMFELNRWYREKYGIECVCVYDELLIRYFVANGYKVSYPEMSRYWRYDTIGMTQISFSMLQTNNQ